MKISKIHRAQTNLFKPHQVNLVYDQESLREYINRPFNIPNMLNQIEEKKTNYSTETRKILVDSLTSQYGSNIRENETKQLDLLRKENTFTITTGHQLSIFTGPLYFVLKILETIKICEELNSKFKDFNFIPVYWMATEDHDFEEIKSVSLFNKDLSWETNQEGAVGRFKLDGFEELKTRFASSFRDQDAEIHALLKDYSGENLAAASRDFVRKLFADKGLIVVDGDDLELKKIFSPVMMQELESRFSYEAVLKTNEKLKSDGIPIQVNPREINLFRLSEQARTRVVADERSSLQENIAELDKYPQQYSPNVILRPLYQEKILPNLLYVGGAGEISYWLQLKSTFEEAGITYPMIKVRNSIQWVKKKQAETMSSLGLVDSDLFRTADELITQYMKENKGTALNFDSIDKISESLKAQLTDQILKVDSSWGGVAGAESNKIDKQIEQLKAKLIKQEKSKHEREVKAIQNLKEQLFPNKSLQERSINFFSLSPSGNYTDKIEKIYSALSPLENDLILIKEE